MTPAFAFVAMLCGSTGNLQDNAPDATDIDAIVVTGSRIRRVDTEGPLPISVIEREELKTSGALGVADLFRDVPNNSFGGFADVPNSTLPTAAVPGLRGLNGRYTLTLFDGQRLPTLADGFYGGASSLTGIPQILIDRVEILRDGASAIYGSDAIGGVVNLLTRDDLDAPLFDVQWEMPSGRGGDAHRGSFATGGGEDTRWVFAAETLRRDPLRGADRPYLLAAPVISTFGDPGSFQPLNPTTLRPAGPFRADPRCPAEYDTDPAFPNSRRIQNGPNTFCVYRFRAENDERAGLESLSVYADVRHRFASGMALHSRVLAIRNDSSSQLAPAPVTGVVIPANAPTNPTRNPGPAVPIRLNYRLGALGPRINDSREDNVHGLVKLSGEADSVDAWTLAFIANRYSQSAQTAQGGALRSVLIDAIQSGRFDPFSAAPGDTRGLDGVAYRAIDVSDTRSVGLEGTASLSRDWAFGSASLALGFEARRDEFSIEQDPARVVGALLGAGIGVNQDGSRSYGALYVEALQPIGDEVELNAAARYDHYQDAGGALSPKLSLLWRPTPDLLLRGSLSRGFQAPDLASAYGGAIGGLAFVIDRPNCLAAGGTGPECVIQGFDSQIVPNPSLQPERAWQGGLGVVWQAGHFDVALDAWRLGIEDQVGILRAQTVVDNQTACAAAGRPCDRLTEGEVLRTAQGTIVSIVQPRINIARQDASGIDLDIGARLPTAHGDWRWRLRASHLVDLEQRRAAGSATENQLQYFGFPDLRASSTLGWSSGAHALSISARFTDGYRGCALPTDATGAPDAACRVFIRSHVEWDGRWHWQAPWNAEVGIGVRNWRNRPVPVSPTGEFAYGLYDPIGRVWFANYAQQF